MAWSAAVASAAYYVWVGVVCYLRLPLVVKMQEGLGMNGGVVAPYLLLGNHPWVSVACAVVLSAAVLAKEAAMRDKRRSIVITCLVAVFVLIIVDVSKVLLLRPFFLIIEQMT